jgi:hypothetical protein
MRLGFLVWGAGFGFAVIASGCGQPADSVAQSSPTPPATPNSSTGIAVPAAPKPGSLASAGIPMYPGANVSSSDIKDQLISANMTTADTVDQVIAYYEKELGVKPKREGPLTTFDVLKNGMQFAVVVTNAKGSTSIGILGERK